MERPGGGFDWSYMHNSPFELSKMALMNFSRLHRDLVPGDLTLDKPNPGGSVTTSVMVPTLLHKYLGVIVDPKLHWSLQHTKSFTMVLKNLAPTSSTTHHCVLHCFSLFCGRHTSVLMSCDLGLNSWLVNWASWNCCISPCFILGFSAPRSLFLLPVFVVIKSCSISMCTALVFLRLSLVQLHVLCI